MMLRQQQYFFNRYSYDEMIFFYVFLVFPGWKWLAWSKRSSGEENQQAVGWISGESGGKKQLQGITIADETVVG